MVSVLREALVDLVAPPALSAIALSAIAPACDPDAARAPRVVEVASIADRWLRASATVATYEAILKPRPLPGRLGQILQGGRHALRRSRAPARRREHRGAASAGARASREPPHAGRGAHPARSEAGGSLRIAAVGRRRRSFRRGCRGCGRRPLEPSRCRELVGAGDGPTGRSCSDRGRVSWIAGCDRSRALRARRVRAVRQKGG